ncbi:uncharacterized protein LOC106880563 [Octopus bimaculoides]|uniref:Uncharacterized protein n=1 Tax=Octopus bimaculoides TaxID=37653 RepID=A0A0L8FXE6_OCTBM|nr:uncharacterized protein LOC106880563 [Octopus bimaculoides]|eukprot:XP_014786041.1 PREDICTED: uncharacterized protein LOC106880563 [Octopus bimaculoides]
MENTPDLEGMKTDKEGENADVGVEQNAVTESSHDEDKPEGKEETMPETSQLEPKASEENEISKNEQSPEETTLLEEVPLAVQSPSNEDTELNPSSSFDKPEQESNLSQDKKFDKSDEVIEERQDPKQEPLAKSTPDSESSSNEKLPETKSNSIFNYIDNDLSEASEKSNSKTQELDSLIKYYLKQDSRKNSDGIFIAPVHKICSQNSRLNHQSPVNLNTRGQEEFSFSNPEHSLNSVILDSVRTRKLAHGIHPVTLNAYSSKHKASSSHLWHNDKDRNKIIESLERASQNYSQAMKTLEDLADRLKLCES